MRPNSVRRAPGSMSSERAVSVLSAFKAALRSRLRSWGPAPRRRCECEAVETVALHGQILSIRRSAVLQCHQVRATGRGDGDDEEIVEFVLTDRGWRSRNT